MPRISRRAMAAIIAVSTLLPGAAFAADPLKEIRIDWATYNPVSMVLKQKGLLEKEFAKDGISVVWVQSAGSNKALEFLNAGSIDFGSTAGSAALVARINGNPIRSIYVYSRPEWTALVTGKDSKIASVTDLKGKRVAVTRGTDPHIFLVRALLGAGMSEKDITPVLLQHADGKTALIRGDVDAWAGLDPMMAQAEVEEDAKLFFRKPAAPLPGAARVGDQLALLEHERRFHLRPLDGHVAHVVREAHRREAVQAGTSAHAAERVLVQRERVAVRPRAVHVELPGGHRSRVGRDAIGRDVRENPEHELRHKHARGEAPEARCGVARIHKRALGCDDAQRHVRALVVRQFGIAHHLHGHRDVRARVVDRRVDGSAHLGRRAREIRRE